MLCTVYHGEGCRQELATKETPQDGLRRAPITEILLSSLIRKPKFPEKAISLLKFLQFGSDCGEMEQTCICLLGIETKSLFVAQAGLTLMTLLLSQCWDYSMSRAFPKAIHNHLHM